MPLSSRQTRQLRLFLRRLSAANAISSVPGGTGKALEAWVFMTLADAANQKVGWHVSLRQGDGSPLPIGQDFLFSGGPSGISRGTGGPCFAQITRTIGAPVTLELHHGLQHRGRSEARHEWDVALIPDQISNHIRGRNQGYPLGLPFLGIECKDKASSGDTDEMRQTLARMFDLTHVSQRRFPISNRLMSEDGAVGVGRRWPTYIANFRSGFFGIVRMGGFQLGARQLSDHFGICQIGHVTPNSAATQRRLQDAMSEVLDRIDELY